MANMIIKPAADGNLVLQDRAGGAVLTTAATGATIADGIALGTPASGVLTNMTGAIGSTVTGFTGIKEYDEWRLTSDFTSGTSGAQYYLTANLERVDTAGFQKLGTGMGESSGIFSFPTTGYWRVSFCVRCTDNARFDYNRPHIWLTTDGSNYVAMITGCLGGDRSAGDPERSTMIEGVFDITSTTNCKVKFSTQNSDPVTINGNSSISETYFTFMRIGDT